MHAKIWSDPGYVVLITAGTAESMLMGKAIELLEDNCVQTISYTRLTTAMLFHSTKVWKSLRDASVVIVFAGQSGVFPNIVAGLTNKVMFIVFFLLHIYLIYVAWNILSFTNTKTKKKNIKPLIGVPSAGPETPNIETMLVGELVMLNNCNPGIAVVKVNDYKSAAMLALSIIKPAKHHFPQAMKKYQSRKQSKK